MARIPDSTIAEVKDRSDIVDIISRYVNFTKKSGANNFALCPFHSESTPSFSVNSNKQIFHCFGCHKGGDVITFIMDIEHLSYPETIKFLGDIVGVEVSLENEDDEKYQEAKKFKERLLELNTEAARYYFSQLNQDAGKVARSYLNKRGISVSTARRFGLGYADESWQGLYDHIVKKGFSPNEIEASGLFRKNKHNRWYDLFRNRLMFPIIDAMGGIIAFGGRVLDDSLPKYVNSPENKLYTKGKHVYGLNIAKRTKSDSLIVVEGYMDCISLHQAGFDQAVATLGTAMTTQQASLLRKYREKIILAYDMDSAGRTASLHNIDILEDKGVKAFVLNLPESKDPDEYLKKHSAGDLKLVLDEAMEALDYKFSYAKNLATQDGFLNKLEYQDLALDVISEINNAVVRELSIKRLSNEINISEESLNQVLSIKLQNKANDSQKAFNRNRFRREVNNRLNESETENNENNRNNNALSSEAPAKKNIVVSNLELQTLYLLAANPDIYEQSEIKLNKKWFRAKEMRDFLEKFLSSDQMDINTLVNYLNQEDDELREVINTGISRYLIEENQDNYQETKINLKRSLYNLKLDFLTRISNYYSNQLDKTTDPNEIKSIRENFIKVRKEKNETEDYIKKNLR